jgi:methionyl aminopeptidase
LGESTLYRVNPNRELFESELKLDSTKKLLDKIKESFNTLPFTDRYVELFNISNYKTNLKILSNNNYLHSYPPLCANYGAYTAQYEHTVYIGEDTKIIFSSGEDY